MGPPFRPRRGQRDMGQIGPALWRQACPYTQPVDLAVQVIERFPGGYARPKRVDMAALVEPSHADEGDPERREG